VVLHLLVFRLLKQLEALQIMPISQGFVLHDLFKGAGLADILDV